jgi:chorismate-pyruvate lyase
VLAWSFSFLRTILICGDLTVMVDASSAIPVSDADLDQSFARSAVPGN